MIEKEQIYIVNSSSDKKSKIESSLINEIVEFAKDYDYYSFRDDFDNDDDAYKEAKDIVSNNNFKNIKSKLKDILLDSDKSQEDIKNSQKLLAMIENYEKKFNNRNEIKESDIRNKKRIHR